MTFHDRRRRTGVTLVELMSAITVTAVLMLIGMTTWELMMRGTRDARNSGDAHAAAFAVLERIEREVMRAAVIQVPDPSYAAVPSMLLTVPVAGGTQRRAFRLVSGQLWIDLRDEGVAPYAAFDNVTALTFALVDAPTNSQVQVDCTCQARGRSVTMRTVAGKRN